MKKMVQIRPEQARRLIALHRDAKEATDRFEIAVGAVLAGLVDGKAKVEEIADDGRVTLAVQEDG